VALFVANEIRFEAPETWIDASVLSLVSPEEGPFRANVLVTRDSLPDGETLDAYVDAQQAELRKKLKAFASIKRETTAGGVMIEHSFKSQENHSIRQRQLYRLHQGTVYAVSMTHLEPRFESALPIFERVAATLAVE
jgi:hypothetical protein